MPLGTAGVTSPVATRHIRQYSVMLDGHRLRRVHFLERQWVEYNGQAKKMNFVTELHILAQYNKT